MNRYVVGHPSHPLFVCAEPFDFLFSFSLDGFWLFRIYIGVKWHTIICLRVVVCVVLKMAHHNLPKDWDVHTNSSSSLCITQHTLLLKVHNCWSFEKYIITEDLKCHLMVIKYYKIDQNMCSSESFDSYWCKKIVNYHT